ncbi:DUF6286 domain-containing protein [Nonomuraea sp. NPDC050663]|uniref:DUF6286 domain-containing protein n=1 Tax=Nonomuraea sp. NPDC050663 TaxID=3364370 RepID=UPI0037ADBC95
MSDRAARNAFRPRRTVPAVIVAILLAALGIVVAIEVISSLLGSPARLVDYDGVYGWATTTPWSDPMVLIAFGLVAALGLVLLVTALRPGQPRLMPVRTDDPDLIIGIPPKSFARALAHAAEEVPGVRAATASVRGNTVSVTAGTSGWNDAELSETVRQAVQARVAALRPVEPYRVTVTTKEET